MEKGEKHFDEWSKEYRNGYSMPYFQKWMFNKILKEIDLKKNPKILDLGTGDGSLLLFIAQKNPNCKFIGLDISKGMLEEAENNFKKLKLRGKFIKVNMESDLPLNDGSIDYIVSSTAIHHVKSKKNLFSEIYRILNNGGKLLVMDQFDKEDKQYKGLKRELKKDKPSFWKKYIESFDKIQRDTLSQFKKMKIKHPKEYHLAPFTVGDMLKKVGFQEVRIIPTPKFFVIYFATK